MSEVEATSKSGEIMLENESFLTEDEVKLAIMKARAEKWEVDEG